ncbi:hypothetical protein BDZ89DRAFT_1161302 [Hymenopellis radicata]|nr:hypothetical protein BDZ89DRAFT_1161302 [Hymenopellis radicata]
MEPTSATLDEITTDPISSKLLDFDFIPRNGFSTSSLDGLEYTLGLERGGLDHYRNHTALMSAKLHSDMQAFYTEHVWALLPSTEILESLFDLFKHNREAHTPDGRVLFTDHLPAVEYTYQLLPPVPRNAEQKPLYIVDRQYDPPYNNLPLVRANVHPAFVFCALKDYVMATFKVELDAAPLIDTPLRMLVYQIMGLIRRPIPVTWTNGTWGEYLHRGLVPVKGLPKQPRRKQPPPPVDDGYQTPEERDYKANDPRMLRRQTNVQKYMAENNERSTALAKGNALDIKKHRYISTAANVLDVPPSKRARSPSLSRSESVEEPPAKRGKTPAQQKQGGRRKKSSTGSPAPAYLPTPPLRRSTRKPKNPPKYK